MNSMSDSNINNTSAEKIEEVRKKTGFDEITIGCCLSNFMDKNICSRFTNSGCRNLEYCKAIRCLIAHQLTATRIVIYYVQKQRPIHIGEHIV